MNMVVAVRGFGPLEDVIPEAELELNLPQHTGAIREALQQRWPALSSQRFTIAVDQRIRGEEAIVRSAREIALLPPFAGG
jgi:molybdopterin converting factor small subunit